MYPVVLVVERGVRLFKSVGPADPVW